MTRRISISCVSVLFFSMMVYSCSKKTSNTSGQSGNKDSTSSQTSGTHYAYDSLIIGADMSSVNMVEDNGGVYMDSGKVKDPYLIFYQHGCNTVRLRLFYNPAQTDGYNAKGYCGLTDVEKSMKRAINLGMKVCLDLHYSDTWADPSNQKTPLGWDTTNITVLKDSVSAYTNRILNKLKTDNLTPSIVQIGNETNSGMLWPLGKVVNNNWTNYGILVNAAIQAVRNVFDKSTTQIMLHVAEPQNAQWFISGIINNGGVTDFDILGISYYDNYTTINFSGLSTLISALKLSYNKRILIAETNYGWTDTARDGKVYSKQTTLNGYPVSDSGQYRYLRDLTQTAISGGAAGVLDWEPAWIATTSDWGEENVAFFDHNGHSLPVINFMNYRYRF